MTQFFLLRVDLLSYKCSELAIGKSDFKGGAFLDIVITYIELIRDIAPKEITKIFTCGGCYRFHLILKDKFPQSEAYKKTYDNMEGWHIITKINDKYYDINGEYDNLENICLLSVAYTKIAESFIYPVMQQNEIKNLDKVISKRKFIRILFNLLYWFLLIASILLGYIFNSWFLLSYGYIFCIMTYIVKVILLNFTYSNDTYCIHCGNKIKYF